MKIRKEVITLKAGHHDYDYNKGKKIAKPATTKTYLYIDKKGVLRATEYEDYASHFGGGVFGEVSVNECGNIKGTPVINGKDCTIYGVFKDDRGTGVYLRNREKVYTGGLPMTQVKHSKDINEYAKVKEWYTMIVQAGVRKYDC